MNTVNRIESIELALTHRALVFSKLSSKFVMDLLKKFEFNYKIVQREGDGYFELYLNPYLVDSFYVLYEKELFKPHQNFSSVEETSGIEDDDPYEPM